MPNLKSLKNFKSQIFKLQILNQISNLFNINRKWTWNVYCEKLFARLVHRKEAVKSSNHFKCLSNGQHWIAFAVAVARLFAHSDSLFLHILWPHMSLVSLWSFEICDFQIESRKFESNRKSNPKALNRIFYCEIESLIAVKSRFKSNRDSDLPTTGKDVLQNADGYNVRRCGIRERNANLCDAAENTIIS